MAMSLKPGTFAEPTKQQRLGELRHLIDLTNAQFLMNPGGTNAHARLMMRTSRFYEMVNNIWHIMEGICLPNCALHEFVAQNLTYVANYLDKGVDPSAFMYCTHYIKQLLKCLKHLYIHHFAGGPCLNELKIVYKIIHSFGTEQNLLDEGEVPELQPLGDLRDLISQTNAQYLTFPDDDVYVWIRMRTSRFYEIVQCIRYIMEGICHPQCEMHALVDHNLEYVETYVENTDEDIYALVMCTTMIIRLLKCLEHFYVHHFANGIIVGPCLQELKTIYKIMYDFGRENNIYSPLNAHVPSLASLTKLVTGDDTVA